jgi:hypothetical protein
VSAVTTKAGSRRFRVFYRLRWAASPKYAGSFTTRREANARKAWVLGELAAMRVPDLTVLRAPAQAPTLHEAGARWLATRIDVAESTKTRHVSELTRIGRLLGARRVDGASRPACSRRLRSRQER